MCDYSLTHYPNRLARQGEELTVRTFFSGSRGFVSAEPASRPGPIEAKPSLWKRFQNLFGQEYSGTQLVVCIPPGARLRFDDVPVAIQRKVGCGPSALVTFAQTSMQASTYRDAVRFEGGETLSVQALPEKMRAIVVSMGGEAEPAVETHADLAEALHR